MGKIRLLCVHVCVCVYDDSHVCCAAAAVEAPAGLGPSPGRRTVFEFPSLLSFYEHHFNQVHFRETLKVG